MTKRSSLYFLSGRTHKNFGKSFNFVKKNRIALSCLGCILNRATRWIFKNLVQILLLVCSKPSNIHPFIQGKSQRLLLTPGQILDFVSFCVATCSALQLPVFALPVMHQTGSHLWVSPLLQPLPKTHSLQKSILINPDLFNTFARITLFHLSLPRQSFKACDLVIPHLSHVCLYFSFYFVKENFLPLNILHNVFIFYVYSLLPVMHIRMSQILVYFVQ